MRLELQLWIEGNSTILFQFAHLYYEVGIVCGVTVVTDASCSVVLHLENIESESIRKRNWEYAGVCSRVHIREALNASPASGRKSG